MRGGRALIGMLAVAGCAAPRSSGVVPLDPGSYGLTVTSRSLGTAAEMALSEATGFCTRQGEQTQLLRTRINPGDYQVVFRCVDAVPPAHLAGRAGGRGSRGDTGGPAPETAPILRGQAFAAQAAMPMPQAPQPVALPLGHGAGLGPSGLPVQPPTLGALMAAARPAPLRDPVALSPASFGPSPLPAGMQPYRVPEPLAPPPVPLQSPLAGLPAARRSEPVFAPLPASALVPVVVPRSFETLPSVTGLPGGPPPRALTPLPPIGEPPQRGFVTDVPARLPPPATGPVAAGAVGSGGASVTPPPGFWGLRRN